jgi:hypothetical protein
LFGFAILTRETLLYLVPVVALWLWFRPSRDRVLPLALVLTTFAVVAPWTARNAIQFGAFIPVSTGGGLNLYQGNAEVSRDQVYREYYINEGKVEQFEWARTAGLKAIWKRQPGWIFEKIRDEGPRLAELDSLALIHLRRGAYESVSCAAYRGVAAVVLLPWLLVAFGAVIGLARMRLDRAAVLLILVAAAYLFLHIATHGFSRYRLPMVPVFVILAASVLGNTGAPPTTRRRLLLGVLTAVLVLLLTPSAMDQAGFLGLAAPPEFEGFPPICPR